MKKIIGTGMGFLFCVMNANAVELDAGYSSATKNVGVDFVLELSAIDYSYPATVLNVSKVKGGTSSNSDAAWDFDYDDDSILPDRSEEFDGFRLTAGMRDTSQSAVVTSKTEGKATDGKASVEKPALYGSGERIAVRDGRLKLAVGVGTTSLESDIVLNARPDAGGSNDVDHAELAALLNEVETETTVNLEDYLDRPVLAIGVNYAF